MPATDDFLDVLQADLLAVLQNVPTLAAASIIADDEGDLDSKVTRALEARRDNATGKRGLVIIVLRPDITEAEKNLPGPPLKVKLEIQTIEQVMFNRDPVKGSQVTSSQAAANVLSALHLRSFGSHIVYADKSPIKSLPVIQGHLSRSVTLYAKSDGLHLAKTSPVIVAIDDSPFHQPGQPSAQVIIFGCETPSVDIFYTTDGSYPSPATGTPYTTFIAMPAAGTIIRAAAYSPAMTPSDILEFTVTP